MYPSPVVAGQRGTAGNMAGGHTALVIGWVGSQPGACTQRGLLVVPLATNRLPRKSLLGILAPVFKSRRSCSGSAQARVCPERCGMQLRITSHNKPRHSHHSPVPERISFLSSSAIHPHLQRGAAGVRCACGRGSKHCCTGVCQGLHMALSCL